MSAAAGLAAGLGLGACLLLEAWLVGRRLRRRARSVAAALRFARRGLHSRAR